MNKKSKIGIIGAGPSGSLTAYLLQKQGHQVHLFDRISEDTKVRKVCGEYLCPAGKDLLHELGLKHLVENYSKVFGMKIFSSTEVEVNTLFPEQQFGYSLRRDQFDQDLAALANQNGVTMHWDTTIASFEYGSDKVTLVDQNANTWTFDYLIGADGRQSHVAKWIDVKKTISQKKVAIHCYLDAKLSREILPQGEMHLFEDGSYCGLNPIEGKNWNFSIVCDANEVKNAESTYDLIQSKIKKSKRLTELFDLPPEENLTIKVVANISNSVSGITSLKHKTLLVGDASGFVDPLTGEGIYHAILTAKVLSDIFKTTQSDAEIFKGYEKLIHAVYYKKVVINYFFQWLIKHPQLCHFIAVFLRPRKRVRDTFVGLIGNVYSPLRAIKLMFLYMFM